MVAQFLRPYLSNYWLKQKSNYKTYPKIINPHALCALVSFSTFLYMYGEPPEFIFFVISLRFCIADQRLHLPSKFHLYSANYLQVKWLWHTDVRTKEQDEILKGSVLPFGYRTLILACTFFAICTGKVQLTHLSISSTNLT